MDFPKDQRLFTIRELARACGVSRTTIIRIEECGFLTPCYVNPETGYRYYNAYNASQVGQYLLLQSLGLTRQEIVTYFYRKGDIQAFLKAQREKLDRMEVLLEEMELRNNNAPGFRFSHIFLAEQVCYCVERRLASVGKGENFFFSVHEQCIKEGFQLLGKEPLFGLRSDDWRTGSAGEDRSLTVTACIPVAAPPDSDPRLVTFPAVRAFSAIAYGDYGMISKLYQRFWQETEARGIRPAGPVRFYGLVAPYTGNHLSPRDFCYRMAVPVAEEIPE